MRITYGKDTMPLSNQLLDVFLSPINLPPPNILGAFMFLRIYARDNIRLQIHINSNITNLSTLKTSINLSQCE